MIYVVGECCMCGEVVWMTGCGVCVRRLNFEDSWDVGLEVVII